MTARVTLIGKSPLLVSVLFWGWLLAAGCIPAAAVSSENLAAPSAEVRKMEEEVRQRLNEVRREHGLAPLQGNRELARLAKEHSRRMAREQFFDHVDPKHGDLADRLRQAGIDYRGAGENIFSTTNVADPVEFVVRGWLKSPGHRANILRPEFDQTGVGIWQDGATFYFTQIFLRGR